MSQLMLVNIPLRLGRGLNDRDAHWRKRHRRVRDERDMIAWALVGKPKPATPCTFRIIRIAPGRLDDDNLPGACKAVRDQLAAWMGVDDRHRDIVRYVYDQGRGGTGYYGVTVQVTAGLPPEVA
jgi:hypothetical protein